MAYSKNDYTELRKENHRLRQALLLAIPWIGYPREGESYATPEDRCESAERCGRVSQAAVDVLLGRENNQITPMVE